MECSNRVRSGLVGVLTVCDIAFPQGEIESSPGVASFHSCLRVIVGFRSSFKNAENVEVGPETIVLTNSQDN